VCISWIYGGPVNSNSHFQQNDRGRSEYGVGPFQIGNGRDGQQHDGPASKRHRQSFTTDLQFITQTSNNDERQTSKYDNSEMYFT